MKKFPPSTNPSTFEKNVVWLFDTLDDGTRQLREAMHRMEAQPRAGTALSEWLVA